MSLGNVGAPSTPLAWLNKGWHALAELAHDAITHFKQDEASNTPITTNTRQWGIVAVDLHDDDNLLEAIIELPGMNKEDVHVELTQATLVISGSKKSTQQRNESGYLITERAFGSFQRTISLPKSAKIDRDATSAEYENGILTVKMPKLNKKRSPIKLPVH